MTDISSVSSKAAEKIKINRKDKAMEGEKEYEVIKTERGKRKILHNGSSFVLKKKLAGGKELFECTRRRDENCCYATLHFKDGEIVAFNNDHYHAPDLAKNAALKIMDKIKSKAKETVEKPHQILQGVCQEMNIDNAANLPSISNQKRQIRSVRKGKENAETSDGLGVIRTVDSRRFLENGEDFLLFNSFEHRAEKEKNQMIILGTFKSLEILKESDHWFADGTFDIAPNAYYQVYTIHCLHMGRVFPCLYAVMSNKKQSMYTDFFEQVREYVNEKCPETVTLDFEIAAINALELIFPNAEINGCFFHLKRSMYRKIQALGYQKEYCKNLEFASKCKMIAALAFVPLEEVEKTFHALKENLSGDERFTELLKYFEVNYIGNEAGNIKAKFGVPLWNVTRQISQDLPKTNNYVEGNHNRVKHALGCSHPTLGVLIDTMKKEHLLTQFLMTHTDMKIEKVKQRSKDARLQERLKKIVEDYTKYRPLYFLQLIVSNFSLLGS